MKVNKKGHITFRATLTLTKAYLVKALAWEVFTDRKPSFDSLSIIDALVIGIQHLYRYGRSGWQGSTDTEQTIGTDTDDEYNRLYDKAEEYVSTNFPQLK